LHLENDKAVVDEGTCIDCGACIATCPVQAISE
jgi:NAD-dependent dihydropyrimidine dehydrogenase PreA subunit